MPRVLIGPYLLRNQPGRFRQILTDAGFELIDPVGDFSLTAAQLRPHLPELDAMLAGGERMTPDLFAIAPRLRAIARTGVGYDLIDVAAASAHKVAVTITPGTNQESVAEQTMALLLALIATHRPQRSGHSFGRMGSHPRRTGSRPDPGIDRHGPDRPCRGPACPGVSDARRGVRHISSRRIRRAARYRAAVAR